MTCGNLNKGGSGKKLGYRSDSMHLQSRTVCGFITRLLRLTMSVPIDTLRPIWLLDADI